MAPNHNDRLTATALALLIVAGSMVALLLSVSDLSIFAVGVSIAAMGGFITAAITLISFSYSHKTDQTVESHLRDHRLAPGRAKRSRRARNARAIYALYVAIGRLMDYCSALTKMGARSAEVPDADWPQFWIDFLALRAGAAGSARALALELRDADHLDITTGDEILAVIDMLGGAAPVDDGKRAVDVGRYHSALNLLDPILAGLRRRLDLVVSRLPPLHGAPGGLHLSLDRDTYPPGATIRATVTVDEGFPDGEATVAVFDEGLGVLIEEAAAVPVRAPGQPAPRTLTIDVSLEGLAAGQEYTARAACGGLADEVAFAVGSAAPAGSSGDPGRPPGGGEGGRYGAGPPPLGSEEDRDGSEGGRGR